MNYFLCPLTSQIVGNQTVSAPKYLRTDLSGLAFSCIPFGGEGTMCILTLAAPNPALAAESDVYAFSADLTATMSAPDVALLDAFLTAANIPSDQLSSGMSFGDALQIIARVFLAAQALFGLTGSAIFTDPSVTLDSTVGDSGVAAIAPTLQLSGPGNSKQAGGGSISGGSQQQTVSGPFDFSGASSDDLIGDTLDSVSQQFTSAVNLGSF
jgi:hypothetical protein